MASTALTTSSEWGGLSGYTVAWPRIIMTVNERPFDWATTSVDLGFRVDHLCPKERPVKEGEAEHDGALRRYDGGYAILVSRSGHDACLLSSDLKKTDSWALVKRARKS
ncbi:hypothetical protein K523DRAFT_323999, partial [Schizophyllum commune Tattone D]